MDKQKIWLISIMGTTMAVGITFTLFLAFSTPKQEGEATIDEKPATLMKQPEEDKVTTKNPLSSDEGAKGADEIKNKNDLKATDIYQVPKEDKKRITTSDLVFYETPARMSFRKLDFNGGLSGLDDPIKEFNLEEDGKILRILQNDATLISNFEHSHADEEEQEQEDHEPEEGEVDNELVIKEMLTRIQDPEMALLGILSMDFQGRSEFILSAESINPIVDGGVEIVAKEEIQGEMVQHLSSMYTGVKKVHKIEFISDGYSLYGYIIQYENGNSRLHSIEEVKKGSTPFKTIQEWDSLLKKTIYKKDVSGQPSQSSVGGVE